MELGEKTKQKVFITGAGVSAESGIPTFQRTRRLLDHW